MSHIHEVILFWSLTSVLGASLCLALSIQRDMVEVDKQEYCEATNDVDCIEEAVA